MKLLNLLTLAASAKLASAHATVMAAWLNDVDLGLGNSASGYIRSPPNNSPITDVTSPDMSCNVNGGTAVARTIEVEAGDKFTFEWHHNDRSDADDIIDLSHKGPVLVYIAPTAAGTAGTGWVKIAEDGYDGEWAVERLVANRGQHSVTIPDIAAGEYLLRAEIIALHEGNRVGGAQFYMECVQIQVTSSGSTTLPSGVAIPGAYSAEDPGILFNLYNGFTSYTIPGPAVWDGASGGDSAPPASSAPTSPATTLSTVTTTRPPTTATSVPESATSETPSTSTGAAQWAQCGGTGFSGPTTCSGSFVCTELNPYYSQCI